MVNKKYEILSSNVEEIVRQLDKYNILGSFFSKNEVEEWILQLNDLEMHNILSLDVEPESIKFDPKLLIDKNLLNTLDYNARVEILASIQNAEGYYHLFDRMLRPEFLNSGKFYQDIETLKRAKCAQTSLWIIGEPSFINSPFHDEDFELLVTAKDISEECCDYVVWDTIATVAPNTASIYSGYHKQDLQTILKYGSKSLQTSNAYPERTISYLAIHPVSLKDIYHLENMEILAENYEIGNFLYAVMTNSKAIKKKNYRVIINEMVENKSNKNYVFLVCYYAVGRQAAMEARNLVLHEYFFEIINAPYITELLKQVDDRIKLKSKDIIDGEFKDATIYEIEGNVQEDEPQNPSAGNLLKRLFKKNKKIKYEKQ